MGGAERMACFLADKWTEAGHVVAILTLDGPHKPYFSLDSRVILVSLGLSGESRNLRDVVVNFRKRLTGVRQWLAVNDCDVAIGFGGACLALVSLATLGLPTRSIAYEQTDPLFTERDLGPLKRAIHRMALRFANAIVVQSRAAREVLDPALYSRTHIIPNPVKPIGRRAMPSVPDSTGRFHVIALGRLDAVKGFDVLLHAWSRVQAALPDWTLVIYGEGEQRERLELIVAEEGLQRRALLPGSTDQVDRCLADANLFVLSSRTEGFPNALCEAMAAGLPVITTDCRCGPAEIVTPERDGIVVPVDDVHALSNAILRLASNPERLAEMGSAASAIVQRFESKKVLQLWNDLFVDLHASR